MPIVKPQSVIVPADPDAPGVSLPLPDGRLVQVRPVTSTDGVRTLRVDRSSSAGPTALLFLTIDPGLPGELVDRALRATPDGLVVIATIGTDLVGVGHLDRRASTSQIDVAVAEGLGGLGLERALSGALAARTNLEDATTAPGGAGS